MAHPFGFFIPCQLRHVFLELAAQQRKRRLALPGLEATELHHTGKADPPAIGVMTNLPEAMKSGRLGVWLGFHNST